LKKFIMPAFASMAVLIVSCDGKEKPETKPQASTSSSDIILARVDGEELTLNEIKYQFPPEVWEQLRGKDLEDAVETWINTQLLAQKGTRMGLGSDPSVEAVVQFRTADAIARRVLEIEIKEINAVSQAQIDSAYAVEKDNYRLDKERLRASHILLKTLEEAEAVHGRLVKGDDFASLVEDYSADRKSAASGGDVGYFSEDQVDPAFAAAAKKLKVGEFSGPIKIANGFHIIMLTDRQESGSSVDSLEVKARIAELLTMSRQNELFNLLLESLRKEAKIERVSVPELDFAPKGEPE